MATITVIQPSMMNETVKRRVAAYCRVSSSSEDQLNSYQAQLTYYSHKFEDSITEELVDLYADEGITGTREDKRDEFQRLMKDCRRGKIDRIYTKSISRFARNTKDCLKNLRELKALGITVFFEKENIDTANMTDEIMITILGGLAQEESVSISQNMRWSVRKRMENGTYVLPSLPYGYTNEKESLIQIPEEIETVKWIFSQYLSGIKMKAIADELNNSGVPTHLNREKWMKNTIRYILTNPVYIGHLLLQKSYTANTFPFVRKDNHGEVPQYLIKNHHKAVISEEDYQRVQDLILENTKQNHTPIDTIFSKKIVCTHCGTYFRRKANKKTVNWVCRTRDNRADSCPIMHISEQKIQQLYIRLFNVLFAHYKEILLPLQQMLQELKWKKYGGNVRVTDIHKEIAKLREQNHVIARLRTKGFMDEGKYQEQSKELNNKIRKLQAELKKITRSDDEDDILEQLDMLIDYFEKREQIMVSFEPETFDSVVDKITANQNELTFHLLGGIELKEKI
ncbi:MAG: recombinase family protein [Oscillospiraceae bacterium]|nr:recombinase family protein [Oscillospiraceae bacterium]